LLFPFGPVTGAVVAVLGYAGLAPTERQAELPRRCTIRRERRRVPCMALALGNGERTMVAPSLASEVIRWIETNCRISQGSRAGELVTLPPWAKRWLDGSFRPGVEVSCLSVGRGAGKSSITGFIGAAAVAGPLATQRAETVIVSGKHEQSRHVQEAAEWAIRDRLETERIPGKTGKRWRVVFALIQDRVTGARLRCIGANHRTALGLAPLLVICDEVAAWEKADDMLTVLLTSLGKVPGSRVLACPRMTTTRSVT